ncbi:MAG: T9SS type A sorting domain-containing protein [Flavobacteriaceae bacterium]|nr:T9SS type A sorting domain-containing protein [Flavobacteriaceae bacterium]
MKYPLKKIIASAILFSCMSVSGQILSEDFENATFPPANWTLTQTNTNETWTVDAKNAKSGVKSAVVFYDKSLAAQNEKLISPAIDLKTVKEPKVDFWFSMSYFWSVSPNNNYDFKVSVNDGTTSTVVWTENSEGSFQDYTWRKVTIDLKAFAGKSNLKLEFSYVGTDGATLHIDDVVVQETAVLSVEKVNDLQVSFYPNPAKDKLYIQSKAAIDQVAIYNTIGQKVYQSSSTKSAIDISELTEGVYFVKVTSDVKTNTYKIVKE